MITGSIGKDDKYISLSVNNANGSTFVPQGYERACPGIDTITDTLEKQAQILITQLCKMEP